MSQCREAEGVCKSKRTQERAVVLPSPASQPWLLPWSAGSEAPRSQALTKNRLEPGFVVP
jgi:hypothetical protein